MLKEFKDFAVKGNLVDIAVGLVMGAAFGTVVTAFVDGLAMPLVGKIFQVGDFSAAKIVLSPAELAADGTVSKAESALMYGKFISTVINFLIIAWVMFLVVKAMNKLKKAEAPPPPAGPTTEELLGQIRDLLKK